MSTNSYAVGTDLLINGVLDFQGLQAAEKINLLTNSKSKASDYDGPSNITTPNTWRVGNPTIEFDDEYTHQLFPLNDGQGTLSTIIYKENDVAASASDYIKFQIPDSETYKFSELNN